MTGEPEPQQQASCQLGSWVPKIKNVRQPEERATARTRTNLMQATRRRAISHRQQFSQFLLFLLPEAAITVHQPSVGSVLLLLLLFQKKQLPSFHCLICQRREELENQINYAKIQHVTITFFAPERGGKPQVFGCCIFTAPLQSSDFFGGIGTLRHQGGDLLRHLYRIDRRGGVSHLGRIWSRHCERTN